MDAATQKFHQEKRKQKKSFQRMKRYHQINTYNYPAVEEQESWTISKQLQKRLGGNEKWFLQRTLRISWTAKKSNKTVFREADTMRSLMTRIRTRQATLFGHVMRRKKLERFVISGNDRRNTQQRGNIAKDVGRTVVSNKVAKCKKSDVCI